MGATPPAPQTRCGSALTAAARGGPAIGCGPRRPASGSSSPSAAPAGAARQKTISDVPFSSPHFIGEVLVLGVAVAPHLIALDPLRLHAADHVVMVLQHGLPKIAGKALDGVLGDPRNSGGSSDGTAVDQTSDDGTSLFVG